MAVSKHPSVKPGAPRRPPSDRGGQGSRDSGQAGVAYGAKNEFQGYEHSREMHSNKYGHQKRLHGKPAHKSEVEGGSGFSKAGSQSEIE